VAIAVRLGSHFFRRGCTLAITFERQLRRASLQPALGDAEISEREVCFCQGIFEIGREQIPKMLCERVIGLPGSGYVGMPLIVT